MARFKQPAGWLRRGQDQIAQVNRTRRQRWFCERCEVGGVVSYTAEESVHAVADRIRDAHAALSSECAAEFGIGHVRTPQGAAT